MMNAVDAFIRAVPDYLRHHWRLSRAYDRLMRWRRGYGGFTGTDRRGYPFSFFYDLHHRTDGYNWKPRQ